MCKASLLSKPEPQHVLTHCSPGPHMFILRGPQYSAAPLPPLHWARPHCFPPGLVQEPQSHQGDLLTPYMSKTLQGLPRASRLETGSACITSHPTGPMDSPSHCSLGSRCTSRPAPAPPFLQGHSSCEGPGAQMPGAELQLRRLLAAQVTQPGLRASLVKWRQ